MPKPLDLTGRVLGRLTVLRRSGMRNGISFWWCQCECGAEFEVPRTRLPYRKWMLSHTRMLVDACQTCAGKPCIICGAPIERIRLPAKTCIGECHKKYVIAYRKAARLRRAKSKQTNLPKPNNKTAKPCTQSPPPGFKHCNKCGRDLPSSDFGRNSSMSDGLHPYCKKCANAWGRAIYARKLAAE